VKNFLLLAALAALAALSACSRTPDPNGNATPPTSSPEIRVEATPAEPPPATDARKKLVVFGDSLSAGYGLEPGESYPDDLQRKLDAAGYAWRVVNLGISGDTTEGGVARLDAAVALKPSIAIVELGGNDGLRGLPLAVTRANLETMIAGFEHSGAKVVLAGMTLPPNYGADYIRGFEKLYKELAAAHHCTLIPFLLADIVTSDLRYLQRDGIHPTAEGAEIVSGTVLRAVKPLLGAAGKPVH
jgi:acyl-CoA thioesterase-1